MRYAGRAPLAPSVADHLYEGGAALLRGRDLVRKGDADAVEALAAPQAHPEAQTVHGEDGRLFGGCIGMGASQGEHRVRVVAVHVRDDAFGRVSQRVGPRGSIALPVTQSIAAKPPTK